MSEKMHALEIENKALKEENGELKNKLKEYEKRFELVKKMFNYPECDIDYEAASISDEEFWEMLDDDDNFIEEEFKNGEDIIYSERKSKNIKIDLSNKNIKWVEHYPYIIKEQENE